jgi:hypothetical protein
LPDASETVVDPLAEVRKQLPTDSDQDALDLLLAAAPSGTEAVKEALRAVLKAALDLDSGDPTL